MAEQESFDGVEPSVHLPDRLPQRDTWLIITMRPSGHMRVSRIEQDRTPPQEVESVLKVGVEVALNKPPQQPDEPQQN